ncbi:MAG: magnesium transporter [Clostridia bacterium]|nr:magnesium transporter [Clostridia bacterium]
MEEFETLGESAETEEESEQLQMPDYKDEILATIRSNASPRMMERNLSDYHPKDIAEVLPELSDKERRKLYRILRVPVLSEILEYGSEDVTGGYMNEMDLPKAAAVLSEMETDIAVAVLREIERGKRLLLIDAMDGETRREVALIASYDEDEIGSRMTTNCIIIRENLTIKQAMTELVEQAARNDNISTLFVVDEYGAFYGALDLKKLIIARETENLENLIVTSFPYVYGHESIEDCIEKLKDYSEDSIPVLDNNNRIQGVITSQSIIEVSDDEMREDYAMLAGLTAREDLEEPLKISMGKRLPWLFVLLGLSLVVSAVVGIFEQVVSQLPLIMAFQSMILGMAGNVGTQSLAVTIRVLMDESLTARQKLTLVSKEIRVGLANGFILGLLSFILVGLFIWLIKGKTLIFAFAVSACIGFSLLLAMLISSAVGTLIPLFFKKINIDPAVASGPLITTVNDLVAVLTYYGISWLLLLNILHLVV